LRHRFIALVRYLAAVVRIGLDYLIVFISAICGNLSTVARHVPAMWLEDVIVERWLGQR